MDKRMREIANLTYQFERAIMDGKWDDARAVQKKLRAMDLTDEDEGRLAFRSESAITR